MKIAIVGLGVAGSYLLNRLARERYDNIYVFEGHKKCNQNHLCGWMTNKDALDKYAFQTDIDNGEDYIIRNIEKAYVRSGEKEIITKTRNAVTFSKPKFLIDMQNYALDLVDNASFGTRVQYSFGIQRDRYDLIIDATGNRRSMLRLIPGARKHAALCRQYTVRYDYLPYDDVFIELFRSGYLWYTPLKDGLAFIGAGSLEDHAYLNKLSSFLENNGKHEIIDVSQKLISLLPPSKCTPFIDGNIVGVGEAIGTTRPFGGEGIAPALRSAEILVDCIHGNEMEEYEHRILKEFKKQEKEWKYVQARLRGSTWGCLRHGMGLKQPYIKLSPRQKLKFLRSD